MIGNFKIMYVKHYYSQLYDTQNASILANLYKFVLTF